MEKAEWPSEPIPEPVKKLITRFYTLLDSPDPQARHVITEKLFTNEGVLVVNKRRMRSAEQIEKWCARPDGVDLRRHTIYRVYVSKGPGDLLMMGSLEMGMSNGVRSESPFCTQCIVDDANALEPKVARWQIWMDHSPFYDVGTMREDSPALGGVLDTIGGR